MFRFLLRLLKGIGILIVLLAVVLMVAAPLTVRRSFPKVSGELHISGLDAPVDIYRDQFGIPHIYASNLHDLFFAQGYVHAQDRFWQMDFWRHIGSGRLSEMFGETQLKTDQFLRTLGWARVAQRELEMLDTQSRDILESYAAGVNAYLQGRSSQALSLEYTILKLLNPDYQIEPWQPLNTMTWAKAMAWDLRGNMNEEIDRAILLGSLSLEEVQELYPPYPADHPLIVSEVGNGSGMATGASGVVNSTGKILGDGAEEFKFASRNLPAPVWKGLLSQTAVLDALLGAIGGGAGSNNWVISGELTETGKPLLANDPHLGIQMPSIWYEVGLHCSPKGTECPFDVVGFSFAGAPGVIIGHNDRIAWGFTNVGPDVMDLYIEKVNPQNPDQYEVDGQWVDMGKVREVIQVAGGDAVEITVRYTRHGPVISDTYGELEGFALKTSLDIPQPYAVSLRWTALEPTRTFQAIWGLNLAQNWEEFRQAASLFDVPAQNIVYADVDGNIGYQMPGKIPIRASGDGRLPVPGWDDKFEWSGYIPFDKLPFSFNPPKGYIVTANNAVVGADYPYLISTEWDYGYRAQRIVQMIEAYPKPIDMEWIKKIQGDNKDLNAETLVPILIQLSLEDDRLESARSLFQGWDYQAHMDSGAAALFEVFWKNLLASTFHDDLPEDYYPEGGSRWFEVMRHLVEQPESPWWDDQSTDEKENRDQIFRRAFAAAVDELEKLLGKDFTKWTWGDLHLAVFRNQSLGKSGVAPIEALFNRGPYRTSGGESIVNATGWNATATSPYEVDWLPSMRMVVDLGNLQNSVAIHTTGQSGHAFHPHYTDMVDLWRNIQYRPMLWDREQIQATAEGYLKLTP